MHGCCKAVFFMAPIIVVLFGKDLGLGIRVGSWVFGLRFGVGFLFIGRLLLGSVAHSCFCLEDTPGFSMPQSCFVRMIPLAFQGTSCLLFEWWRCLDLGLGLESAEGIVNECMGTLFPLSPTMGFEVLRRSLRLFDCGNEGDVGIGWMGA